MLHFLFQNPSLFPTHQLIHTLYLGYSSNLQQKSVCMPVIDLIPLMSTSSFILFSTTLSFGLLDSKETKTSKCSALLLRGWWLGDNWRLQISDLTFILPSPTPHSIEQLSFQWFFKQGTMQKNCPQQTDLSGAGTMMQFFYAIFFFSDRRHALRNGNTECVFSQ